MYSQSLLTVLFVVFSACLINGQDPCASSLLMDHLDEGRRNPNTTTSFDIANICDYQLDESL